MQKIWNFLKGRVPWKLVNGLTRVLDGIWRWLLPFLEPLWRRILDPILRRFADFVWWLLGHLRGPTVAVARFTRLDRILAWEDLFMIMEPYWTGNRRWKSYAFLIATLMTMVVHVRASFYFGVQLKLVNDIIIGKVKDVDYYYAVAGLLEIAVAWAVAIAGFGLLKQSMGLDVRTCLTELTQKLYVLFERFLAVNLKGMDQRLSQDFQIIAEQEINLGFTASEMLLKFCQFFPVLLVTSPILTLCCFACAGTYYIGVFWLGAPLQKLVERQNDVEAAMRTHLQDAPRYGSQIAGQRSESIFLSQLMEKLGAIRSTYQSIYWVNFFLGIWNFFSGKVVENITLVIVGALIIGGSSGFGQMAFSGLAFAGVYEALTFVAREWGGYCFFKMEVDRIGQLTRALKGIGEFATPPGDWLTYSEGPAVAFQGVSIHRSYIGDGSVIEDKSVVFDRDTIVLGRDGQGKSDIANAIARVAAQGRGLIERPSIQKILVVPQNPYIPAEVTARQFLCDLCGGNRPADADIAKVLNLVGLPDLIEGCKGEGTSGLDTLQNFGEKLPVPQQQQLFVARAVLAVQRAPEAMRPEVLVIDQATDGLEPEVEEDIYKVFLSLGVRLITFSNGSRLAKKFSRVIELKENGDWTIFDDAQSYGEPGWKPLLPRFGLLARLFTGEPDAPAGTQ